MIFADSLAAYFDPPFINFSNFMIDYKEVHRIDIHIDRYRWLMFGYCKRLLNILEIPMLSEVNKDVLKG